MNISKEKGKEAQQLAEETIQDVLKVLEEKGKKAEKLAQGAKENAKQATS